MIQPTRPPSYRLVGKQGTEKTRVPVGNVVIGGSSPVVIAGPCAVESREHLLTIAQAVKDAGAHLLRGGVFKPRTSPYSFQGLGIEGLRYLAEAREVTGLPVVTEVMEPNLVEAVAAYADILQIGSRNMQNTPLLIAAARNSFGRPVLLKRDAAATLEEWLLAAEYILFHGNPQVVLCERGIGGFGSQFMHTRNLLDLSCVPLLHQLTHLPVLVDPSHATGRRDLVPPMALSAIAAGADGLMVEVHHEPDQALCDAHQAIFPQRLQAMVEGMRLLEPVLTQITARSHDLDEEEARYYAIGCY